MILLMISSAGSRRRSSVPLTKPIRSFLTRSPSLANSSGQSIAGVEPVRSSKVSLAIRVRPDRLFWTFRTWTLAIMPPRMTSVLSGTVGELGDPVGRQGLEQARRGASAGGSTCRSRAPSSRRRAARRRPAREDRAGSTAPPAWPFRRCRCHGRWQPPGSRPRDRRRGRAGRGVRSSCLACPAWIARGRTPGAGRGWAPRTVEGPGPDQRLDAAAAPTSRVETRSKKSSRLRNGPPCFARLDDRLDRLDADPLDRPQAEVDLPLARDPERRRSPSLTLGGSTSMPIRRQSSMCSTKNLSRSAPSISDESTAAMYSVG